VSGTIGLKIGMGDKAMLKTLVHEAAALASLTLFVGMVAIWAQVFATL